MPDWLTQGFFILMIVGVPLMLIIGAGIAYLQYKKQDEMFENMDELDDEALDAMAEENEGSGELDIDEDLDEDLDDDADKAS